MRFTRTSQSPFRNARYHWPLSFRRALLSLEIHMDQAEAAYVAFGPFEVIQQAPGEVALERNALVHRRLRGEQVSRQVAATLNVVDVAVGAHHVVVGRAVFGEVDCAGCVVVATRSSSVTMPSGDTSQPKAVRSTFSGSTTRVDIGAATRRVGHDFREVIVDAQEVGGRGDGREVAVAHHGRIVAEQFPDVAPGSRDHAAGRGTSGCAGRRGASWPRHPVRRGTPAGDGCRLSAAPMLAPATLRRRTGNAIAVRQQHVVAHLQRAS